jgi:hypothetical protein
LVIQDLQPQEHATMCEANSLTIEFSALGSQDVLTDILRNAELADLKSEKL